MSEEELLKYLKVTDNEVIIDRKFYENVIINCINNALDYKNGFEQLQQENKELKNKNLLLRKLVDKQKVVDDFKDSMNNYKYFNILNELENWLEEELKVVYKDCGHKHNTLLKVYDKLKELEERDK